MDETQSTNVKKVVIVTGGAGQIGSAICRSFDGDNYIVVMADLEITNIKDKIDKLNLKNTVPLILDVTDLNSIESGFKNIYDTYGSIDILINNAGIAVFTPFEKRTIKEFDRVMRVNVYGTFFCSKEALRYMEQQEKGIIVNIGSIYGIVSADPRIYGDSGRKSSEVYAASKAGIIQMTKYLAVHVKNKNIRINCVSPGGVFNNQKEFFVKNYEYKTPMGRMAHENEIARVIKFLCLDDASYITGHNLVVDGGFAIW